MTSTFLTISLEDMYGCMKSSSGTKEIKLNVIQELI